MRNGNAWQWKLHLTGKVDGLLHHFWARRAGFRFALFLSNQYTIWDVQQKLKQKGFQKHIKNKHHITYSNIPQIPFEKGVYFFAHLPNPGPDQNLQS